MTLLNDRETRSDFETVGHGTRLEVQVREVAATHLMSIAQIERWCEGVAISPDEVLKRKRVKALIHPAE
jgi:hypothetical protein